MDEVYSRRYKRVLEVLPAVAECLNMRAVLIGGTALALFHLHHRISIDLDFVPMSKNEKIKEELKGCLSKKGYRTVAGVYKNQFIIQFEETGIKVEFFETEKRIKNFLSYKYGNSTLLVASLEDILELKIESYAERKEARDLFDIFFILKSMKNENEIHRVIKQSGLPKNVEELQMVTDDKKYQDFIGVLRNAS